MGGGAGRVMQREGRGGELTGRLVKGEVVSSLTRTTPLHKGREGRGGGRARGGARGGRGGEGEGVRKKEGGCWLCEAAVTVRALGPAGMGEGGGGEGVRLGLVGGEERSFRGIGEQSSLH